MAASIAALTAGGGGLQSTSDASGNLNLVSGTTTIVAMTSAGVSVTGTLTASGGIPSPSSVLIGGKFTVAMAASACTIAIKTDAGNDPSASEPVKIYVRSATATDGAISLISLTAATSLVIPSTALMGTTNAVASRIYVGALDNAGTIELYAIMTLSGTSLYLPTEQELLTTTAMTTGSDSAQIAYSTTLRSAVGHRVIGYFESTQATAGTWATAASKVQQMGVGVNRTGDVIFSKRVIEATAATGTTQTIRDNTIPQNTEGDQYLSTAFTMSSVCNIRRVTSMITLSTTSGSVNPVVALFEDAVANAIRAAHWCFDATCVGQIMLRDVRVPASVSSITLKIRAGFTAAGTTTLNGYGGATYYGGTLESYLEVEEVMV